MELEIGERRYRLGELKSKKKNCQQKIFPLQYERRNVVKSPVITFEEFLAKEVEKQIALNKQFILESEADRRDQEVEAVQKVPIWMEISWSTELIQEPYLFV